MIHVVCNACRRLVAEDGGDAVTDGRDAAGNPLPRTAAPEAGHARCSCGTVSDVSLPTGNARGRWHTRHKEEAAVLPWSDAAMGKVSA